MRCRLDRRSLTAALCVLVPFVASVAPVAAVSTPSPVAAVAPGPVTMASLQIVNALSGDVPMTLWIGNKVRARGVPKLAATSPILVRGGRQLIRVAIADTGESTRTAAVSGVTGSIAVDVPAGARKTVFVLGTPTAPRSIIVDAPADAAATPALRVVDLRAPGKRSLIRVNGRERTVDGTGVSAAFTVPGTPLISVDGITTDVRPGTTDQASLLFVADGPRGALVGSFQQAVVGVDSLRSQLAPIVTPRQRSSLVQFVGAMALVIVATAAAVSSMLVFRSRSREDRVRNLMARSFGL